jgi:hypothetical protein
MISLSDSRLAFYAGLGFLGGFNERFARDMLSSSAQSMLARSKEEPEEEEEEEEEEEKPADGG